MCPNHLWQLKQVTEKWDQESPILKQLSIQSLNGSSRSYARTKPLLCAWLKQSQFQSINVKCVKKVTARTRSKEVTVTRGPLTNLPTSLGTMFTVGRRLGSSLCQWILSCLSFIRRHFHLHHNEAGRVELWVTFEHLQIVFRTPQRNAALPEELD